jgi:hypothetical protein
LDTAKSVHDRFERSAKKQPGDDKLLAYSPVELLTMSNINRELFFKAVQDPKIKAQVEADWKVNKLISNDPFNVAFAISDPLTNMAIRADMGEEDKRAQDAVGATHAIADKKSKIGSLEATIRIHRERKEYAGLNIWLINAYSPAVSYDEKERWLRELKTQQEQNLKPQVQTSPSPFSRYRLKRRFNRLRQRQQRLPCLRLIRKLEICGKKENAL